MPRQRPLVPNCSSWILPLRVPPSSAAFSFASAGSHTLLPFSPLFVYEFAICSQHHNVDESQIQVCVQLWYLQTESRCRVVTSNSKTCLAAKFVGICQCSVAAFCLQVPKLCTKLDPTLLYILILETYGRFARKNKMLAFSVCLPQPYSSAGHKLAASRSRLHYN